MKSQNDYKQEAIKLLKEKQLLFSINHTQGIFTIRRAHEFTDKELTIIRRSGYRLKIKHD